jgi:hypothetical protein
MLKIRRKANDDVVLTLIGRLGADNVSELSALLAAEPAGRAVVLESQGCRPGGSRHRSVPPGARTRRHRATQLSTVHPGMDRARRRAELIRLLRDGGVVKIGGGV